MIGGALAFGCQDGWVRNATGMAGDQRWQCLCWAYVDVGKEGCSLAAMLPYDMV